MNYFGRELNAYKANLHTHSTRSDGQDAPEDVIRTYYEHGYQFMALTDHNTTKGLAEFLEAGKTLDMIAVPGDVSAETIAGVIADEISIGVVNNKTTAVRLIPVAGKGVGEVANFGGLLGYAPIMPLRGESCAAFVSRGGRIPAQIHSLRN